MITSYLFVVEYMDASVGGRGCIVEPSLWKPFLEMINLLLYFFNSKTQFIKLNQVVIGWFKYHDVCYL